MIKIQGLITALITPYTNEGKVDFDALQELVEWQVKKGVEAFVLCGSTGEGALLSSQEREEITRCVRSTTDKLVIVGCGAPSTYIVCEQVKAAENAGADVVLVITPFYSKPTLDGVYTHFQTVHDTTNIPLIIYNHPGRTGIDLPINFIINLFQKFPRIVGIKDSTPDTSRMIEFSKQFSDYSLLCGDDPFVLASLAQGANGFVSITSNAFPTEMKRLFELWKENEIAKAQQLNRDLIPIHRAFNSETNPIPIKYAVSKLGKCLNHLRLPLLEVSQPLQNEIDSLINKIYPTKTLKELT